MDLTKLILDEIKGDSINSYQKRWDNVLEQCLQSQRKPDNPENKYAVHVKKEDKTVEHLLLGKSGKFAKTIIYFLRAEELSSCKVIITGKFVNL